MKVFMYVKYQFHLFLKNYNDTLVEDALCHQLKDKLKKKASYHGQQAIILLTKM